MEEAGFYLTNESQRGQKGKQQSLHSKHGNYTESFLCLTTVKTFLTLPSALAGRPSLWPPFCVLKTLSAPSLSACFLPQCLQVLCEVWKATSGGEEGKGQSWHLPPSLSFCISLKFKMHLLHFFKSRSLLAATAEMLFYGKTHNKCKHMYSTWSFNNLTNTTQWLNSLKSMVFILDFLELKI